MEDVAVDLSAFEFASIYFGLGATGGAEDLRGGICDAHEETGFLEDMVE